MKDVRVHDGQFNLRQSVGLVQLRWVDNAIVSLAEHAVTGHLNIDVTTENKDNRTRTCVFVQCMNVWFVRSCA